MFSGSFGVRSIVLCKCSGKYIDIYFKLKITCFFIIMVRSSSVLGEQYINNWKASVGSAVQWGRKI